MVVLYFVAYFCDYLFNKSGALYEVTTGTTASSFDGQYTALILRSEKSISANDSGYVNFFVGDATPVYVGEQAYLIDKSGELSSRLNQAAQNQALLNENDLTLLKDSLYDFRTSFRNNEYYEAYHFKYQIESQILDLVNSSIFQSNDVLYSGSYSIFNSDLAGVVMHYTDGLEDTTIDSFDASSFRKSDYSKTIVKSNDYVQTGDPIYKVITSENWYLVIQISNPDAFRDLDIISLEFLKDKIQTTASFELAARGGNYYGIISLSKYMIRYASERYTQISFLDDTYEGLKIPKTAVGTQTYYAVPEEFLTLGGNSSMPGFAVRTKDTNGNETVEMCYPTIIKQREDLCYISRDDVLTEGDVLIKTDSNNQFEVGMTADLSGVYVSSGGSVLFRFVDILGENNGYYIVNENTAGGVRMYDQIFVNYKDARS